MNVCGIEHESGLVAVDRNVERHPRGESQPVDANAGKTIAAEIVDALDLRGQQAGADRRDA